MMTMIESIPIALTPSVIDVENVRGLCNARCAMCNIDSPKVKPGLVMKNEVYEQILHRFEPIANSLNQVNLVGMGEPLLDRQICQKISITKRILPLSRVAIITNASLFNPALVDCILDSSCDDIIISVDSIRKNVYENIRLRLNFEKVMENVHSLIKKRDKGNYQTKVLVRMIEQESNQNEWKEYVDYWRRYLNPNVGDMILLFPAHQWPENEKQAQLEHIICPYVFNRMSLTAEGMIQLCCVDIGADFYALGNVISQDPRSVFNGETFSMIRDAMFENRWHELPYCNRCNVPLQREKRLSVAL